MKKWIQAVALAAIALTLMGCGAQSVDTPAYESPLQTDEGDAGDTLTPIDIVRVDDSTPPEEGMKRSPLTNEWVDAAVADTRPIAVIIPNEASALPQYTLSEASILYEANVEGRMSRLMAIFEDWEDMDKIGNVRSARSYFAYWSFEWDAFLVHFGCPYFTNELLDREDVENIDGTAANEDAFFRTTDRNPPHNAYTSGSLLIDAIEKNGYSTEYRGVTDTLHYRFATKADPNTLEQYGSAVSDATYIDLSGCYPLTRCYFQYNESDGLYYRYQHLSGDEDGPHCDATGKSLSFKNILVQSVQYEDVGNGYLAFSCIDNTQDGWYFTNGRGIHVTWEKSTDFGATRYYDDDGNEITLNTGKTMICVIENDDSFSYH